MAEEFQEEVVLVRVPVGEEAAVRAGGHNMMLLDDPHTGAVVVIWPSGAQENYFPQPALGSTVFVHTEYGRATSAPGAPSAVEGKLADKVA